VATRDEQVCPRGPLIDRRSNTPQPNTSIWALGAPLDHPLRAACRRLTKPLPPFVCWCLKDRPVHPASPPIDFRLRQPRR
jgi:hypothetical protein